MPESTILPGSCYHRIFCGMEQYYLQQQESVLHVNKDGLVINQLDKGFIAREASTMVPVKNSVFEARLREVISELGIPLFFMDLGFSTFYSDKQTNAPTNN